VNKGYCHNGHNLPIFVDMHYSVKELADLYGLTDQAVYKWIREGKIEFFEVTTPGKNY
jgi:excisionase family DNA binding protein